MSATLAASHVYNVTGSVCNPTAAYTGNGIEATCPCGKTITPIPVNGIDELTDALNRGAAEIWGAHQDEIRTEVQAYMAQTAAMILDESLDYEDAPLTVSEADLETVWGPRRDEIADIYIAAMTGPLESMPTQLGLQFSDRAQEIIETIRWGINNRPGRTRGLASGFLDNEGEVWVRVGIILDGLCGTPLQLREPRGGYVWFCRKPVGHTPSHEGA